MNGYILAYRRTAAGTPLATMVECYDYNECYVTSDDHHPDWFDVRGWLVRMNIEHFYVCELVFKNDFKIPHGDIAIPEVGDRDPRMVFERFGLVVPREDERILLRLAFNFWVPDMIYDSPLMWEHDRP